MSHRDEHLFEFPAAEIAEAAKAEAEYHEERAAYWRKEMENATEVVQQTAGVKIKKLIITGGWRPEVVVDYGDPSAYSRMQEAWNKVAKHETLAEQYRTAENVYNTQNGRLYELDTRDVHYFRLNKAPRPEDA